MKVQPVVVNSKDNSEVVDIFFDLTLFITKQNELFVIDNTVADYKDYIDCNTLIIKSIKLKP